MFVVSFYQYLKGTKKSKNSVENREKHQNSKKRLTKSFTIFAV